MRRLLTAALCGSPQARRAAVTLRFGDVGRTTSLTEWGEQRGTPVDRWYISRFLDQHAELISGRVLEVKNDHYASRLGSTSVDVVDIDPGNPHATVVGDLCEPGTLQPGRYDAAIVTQTLQFVAEPAAAVRHLLESLRPGGALLLTVPCLSRLCGSSDLWRWTPAGFARLLDQCTPAAARTQVEGLGNGLAGRAFLFGLAAEDLRPAALRIPDHEQPLIVGAVVQLPG